MNKEILKRDLCARLMDGVKAEMFDNIVKMKEIGRTIQAIGYNKGVPTLLILER